jgi:hypothetical protein
VGECWQPNLKDSLNDCARSLVLAIEDRSGVPEVEPFHTWPRP